MDRVPQKVADPIIKGFIDYGAQGIPLPSVPEMAAVWQSLGLAEYKVATGADPTTTMTEAGEAIKKEIAAHEQLITT